MPTIRLTEMQDRVHAWAEDNYDVRMSHSKDSLFHDEQDIEIYEKTEGAPWDSTVYRLTLDDHSRSQLADRFKLPNRYMWNPEYFPPELRKDCFDFKFRSAPQEDMLVRARKAGDQELCRAILTQQYRPYDNVEFIDAIVEAVSVKGVDPATVRVGNWSVGSDMRGIGILPNITFDGWNNGGPPAADGGGSGGLHPGFKFSNSEIGNSRTRVHGGSWRGYCQNGMIYGWKENNGFAIVHRGRKVMGLMVNEGIADALELSEKGAKVFMEKMSELVERTDIGGIISRWSSKYGFTVESTDHWKAMCESQIAVHGQLSEFDVINSLTYVARDLDNAVEQEQLQIAAGEMVFVDRI